MAGATGSGEEMQTGRVNRAEGRTMLWAQVAPGDANFNGPAIMIVEVAKDAEDPDDYEDGDTFFPSNQFNGLMATGWSGGSASQFGGTPGGTGVIGRGGRNEGKGVVGLGGGMPEPGNGGFGGIGVHGLGGPQAPFFTDPTKDPGAGVVGQGGRQPDGNNRERRPHAAGVIGLAGSIGQTTDLLGMHPLSETGGVGVYAQGADATISMVPPVDASGTIPGPNVPSGPLAPGAGVVGRGGILNPAHGPVAAGVIGLSGGIPIPGISGPDDTGTGNTGVFGSGLTGVLGVGPTAGVRGHSVDGAGTRGTGAGNQGRGGVFDAERSAQVQLTPRALPDSFPSSVPVSPRELPSQGREGVPLPKDGRAGDLLALMDTQRQCTLWFCVRGEDSGPARWAQVLLGTAFDGQD